MSVARGSSDLLKYASPDLRTCTISAFRLARCASATSFSTCAGDLMPSWKASTHSARYCGVPDTTGLGDGLGLGVDVAVVAWPVHEQDRMTSAIAAVRSRLICERRAHDFGRWLRSSRGVRASAFRLRLASSPCVCPNP